MEVDLVAALFFVFVAAWVYLPFSAAMCELLELGDCHPIRVGRDSEVDIRHFAIGYRAFLDERLAGEISDCRSEGTPRAGHLEDEMAYLVLPRDGDGSLPTGSRENPCRTMIVSCGGLELPAAGVYFVELFAEGPIRAGRGGVYRALLSDSTIELDADSRLLRWAHARDTVRAASACWLFGRVSSERAIEIDDGCRFQRLKAPRITFGGGLPAQRAEEARDELAPDQLGVRVEVSAGRWLIQERVTLPAGVAIDADVVVTRPVEVGAGTLIRGSLKSHGDIRLGTGVVVEGSVVAGRELRLGEGCRVDGPAVLAERLLRAETGCRLGREDRWVTVSAPEVLMAPGSVVYGAVWADNQGLVASRRDFEGSAV